MIENMTYQHIASRLLLVRIVEGGKSTLLCYDKLVAKVGRSTAKRLIWAAFYSKTDKWSWKSRKGFRIDFYKK